MGVFSGRALVGQLADHLHVDKPDLLQVVSPQWHDGSHTFQECTMEV